MHELNGLWIDSTSSRKTEIGLSLFSMYNSLKLNCTKQKKRYILIERNILKR
jgi:hypothetical protein